MYVNLDFQCTEKHENFVSDIQWVFIYSLDSTKFLASKNVSFSIFL